ncbi:hypothetical protein D1872_202320 [compost metagenome]
MHPFSRLFATVCDPRPCDILPHIEIHHTDKVTIILVCIVGQRSNFCIGCRLVGGKRKRRELQQKQYPHQQYGQNAFSFSHVLITFPRINHYWDIVSRCEIKTNVLNILQLKGFIILVAIKVSVSVRIYFVIEHLCTVSIVLRHFI